VPERTNFEVYYQTKGQNQNEYKLCYSIEIKKGQNTLHVPVEGEYLKQKLRIDPGQIEGRYKIKSIEVKAIRSD
jgi:hypothetical protein